MSLVRTAAIAAAILALAASVRPCDAEALSTIIVDRAAIGLPSSLAITAIHLSPRLAALDVEPTTVDIDFPAAARPGRVSVRVRLTGARARTVFVPITIAALAEVAIATRDLEPGAIVTAADVRWETRPVDGRAARTAAIGARVSAPIRADEVLDDARLTTPPAIARGTAVAVTVLHGTISIASRGRLEQSTRIGTTARVRLDNGNFASGLLIDADRVRVEVP